MSCEEEDTCLEEEDTCLTPQVREQRVCICGRRLHACHVRRRIHAWIARLLVYQQNLLPEHHVGLDVLSNLRLEGPQLLPYPLNRSLVCLYVCACVCL
jgi:hypothetical protein